MYLYTGKVVGSPEKVGRLSHRASVIFPKSGAAQLRQPCMQVSLAVRGGYVPENYREWQIRERRD